MSRIFSLLILGLLVNPAWSSPTAGLSIFHSGEHCVAYRTKKVLFLVRTVEVVGRNCDVSSQIMPEVGGKYYVEVLIPVDAFKSGEPERDRDVSKILSPGGSPNVTFRSISMTKAEWEKAFTQETFELDGQIQIGETSNPVKATVKLVKGEDGVEVDGLVKATFKSLGLKPPRMAFGMMARVKDDIELHFHLNGAKTLGINSLF